MEDKFDELKYFIAEQILFSAERFEKEPAVVKKRTYSFRFDKEKWSKILDLSGFTSHQLQKEIENITRDLDPRKIEKFYVLPMSEDGEFVSIIFQVGLKAF